MKPDHIRLNGFAWSWRLRSLTVTLTLGFGAYILSGFTFSLCFMFSVIVGWNSLQLITSSYTKKSDVWPLMVTLTLPWDSNACKKMVPFNHVLPLCEIRIQQFWVRSDTWSDRWTVTVTFTLGKRMLNLIQTYHLILFPFAWSLHLLQWCFSNWEETIWPLISVTLTLTVGTNVLAWHILSWCFIFLWSLIKFAFILFWKVAETYFDLWPQFVTLTLSLIT